MRLKNILLVVENAEVSAKFYRELFGLQKIRDFGSNQILTEGIVLQEKSAWEQMLGEDAVCGKNFSALYFVEEDLERFQKKLEDSAYEIQYVHKLKEYSWGQRAIRIYDPDGHLIEIGEPAGAGSK